MNRILSALLLPYVVATGANQTGRPASAEFEGSAPSVARQAQSPSRRGEEAMKGSHVHLGVKDLAVALRWLEKVWQVRPTFQNERMATIPFGTMTLILDVLANDSAATIGFESSNCDADVRAIEERGGVVLERPTDRPWGVRSAYIQGPGALKFEIEQQLPRPQ